MTAPNAKFTAETVLNVKHYSEKLIRFTLTRPATYRFSAGQFSRLGVLLGDQYLWRAYSIVSAEYDETLDYFVVLIQNGPMSAALKNLQEGDTLLLDKTATGFLLPGRFVDGKELVMLSTGSGIAPFLSMLRMPNLWQRFEKLYLAHSVSYAAELVFNESIQNLQHDDLVQEFFEHLTFLPITTRDKTSGYLHERLPTLIQSGALETAFHTQFSTDTTRFMICGNPAMVSDTFNTLTSKGYAMHRNKVPGHIVMENGF